MHSFFWGIDVSKGYADFCCINQAGSQIGDVARFDDTPEGHGSVKALIEKLRTKFPDAHMVFGLENSGGLERNWAVFLKTFTTPFGGRVFTLNPLAIKRFLDRDLHRSVTDRISAQGIAKYLRTGIRPNELPFEDSLSGPIALYRHVRNIIHRLIQMKNELQSLLPRVQPELIQFSRKGLPNWILQLLVRWPTAQKLASATMAQLSKIPYVTPKKAEELITSAKQSVAAQGDSFTAITVSALAKEIIHVEEVVEALKKQVIASLENDPGVKILESIPGIGIWSAVGLRIEIGSIERFPSPEALVAFAGIDPRIRQSGDSSRNIGISHRGKSQIRAILYTLILTATRCNPVIKAFYARLRANGKGHKIASVACMRKLLHIIYGCWISGKPFNPLHEQERQKTSGKPIEPKVLVPENPPPSKIYHLKITSPVSRREAAKRRKAATLPQTGIFRQKRGPGTASGNHVT